MIKNCPFCKIVTGDIKSYEVFNNQAVKAILDINPVSEGHTLVIPKQHFRNIFDITDSVLKEIIVVARKLAIDYKRIFKVKGVNLLNASGGKAQQSVFHFHIHLVPRYNNDEINLWFHQDANKEIDISDVFKNIKQGQK